MSKKIELEILTPERSVYRGEVLAARLPGAEGYFGVEPGHTLFLAALGIGEIKVQTAEETHYFATSGGIAEVLPHSISVLATTAEPAAAIDVHRAQQAKERAEKRLREGRQSWDVARAKAALMRALNRIRVASRV